ncbi:enoyl-CoA hydratase/isomerase family protein [Phenylobacterium sp. 20VBR1]|uniref:Enoyl-CoA hydratase/isomerase family protein n=1 Tax=Phenylobacterium glaciei TaxID=2803784 RepID=A0A941CZW1_9CAUL|nr:enoyl-CoA hydratase-related protein [Phenylobacterium glaciei]MBR7619671.1 enoyl-CoA hydratase/isomerase family protein [Phenylobacterium glaciei]
MTNPIADPLVEVPDTDLDNTLVRIEATVEGVAIVTINRPERRNAFDARLIAALYEAFETLQGAEGVRVVFLRGAGGMFSAGADLDWMREAADRTESDNRDDAYAMAKMLKSLWDIPALTVALVEGGAFGGGAGLATACDMAIATADAKFSFSEVRLGLIAATISPYVVGAVGPRTARALFATGQVFDAAYAEKVGLVTEVVADVAALDAARARIATEMMACAPGAVADSKKLVEDVAYKPIEDVMEETAKRIARTRVSPEGQEGVRAFLDKRKASWVV